MIHAILFDLGDTLFDFGPKPIRADYEQAGMATYEFLRARGHSLPPFPAYFRKHYHTMLFNAALAFITGREFDASLLLRKVLRKLNCDISDADWRELSWLWYSPVPPRTTVAPSVIPALTRLRDRGLKLALISNTCLPGFLLDRHLTEHDLLDFFPIRIYSSELGARKPNPRIFSHALGRLGVRAADSIFVGDLLKNDVRGAQRAGMRAVLRDPSAKSHRHPVANLVIRNVAELPTLLPMLESHTLADAELVEALVSE